MEFIKRNGQREPFNIQKIFNAVDKGFQDTRKCKCPDNVKDSLIELFYRDINTDRVYDIEQIQDMVEETLMREGFYDVARDYILYRANHRNERLFKERLEYAERYVHGDKNAATSSETDANANVSIKNVANLDGEFYKTTNRQIQRYRMEKRLEKLFPEVSKQYVKDLESHIFYVHDESSSPVPKPYCQASSMYNFVQYGTAPLDGTKAGPPTNLSSFAGQFGNLIFLISSQIKGAGAYGELWNVFDYYCVKDFGEDYPNRCNEFVTFGPKMRELMRRSGRWFNDVKQLADYDFGDKELNAIKKELVGNATRNLTGKELDRWYEGLNHPESKALKLGDGTRTVGSIIEQTFQQIVYTLNQPAGNRGYQSPFTNVSYYDSHYWKALFENFSFPDGTQPKWERVNFIQRKFMKWFNRERAKTLLTFPVETMALLTDGKEFLDNDYKNFTAEMYSEGHSFFTYISDNPNALASCCRLRNEITENTFSFSTGLTGVQTGSCNVITLNIARITQDWAKKNRYDREYLKENFFKHQTSYVNYLTAILDRVYKYHIAYKDMLYEMEDAGMITSSKAGYISMIKLYSTIGENGVNEAAEFLGMTCSYNEDYKKFCRLVTGTISSQNKAHSTNKKYLFNQEFVPAESLSSKNLNWDKEDGYWVPEGRILYNSYFYLADDPNTGIGDKFLLHGKEFTELLDGGVGLHCNLQEHLSKEQYLKILDYAVQCGTSYFTFNIPNSECTNPECHHIVKSPMDTCPVCGSPMIQWTRIIGYLRPVTNFEAARQREANRRYYVGKHELPDNIK